MVWWMPAATTIHHQSVISWAPLRTGALAICCSRCTRPLSCPERLEMTVVYLLVVLAAAMAWHQVSLLGGIRHLMAGVMAAATQWSQVQLHKIYIWNIIKNMIKISVISQKRETEIKCQYPAHHLHILRDSLSNTCPPQGTGTHSPGTSSQHVYATTATAGSA